MNDELRSAILRSFPFLIVIVVILILIRRQKLNPLVVNLSRPVSLNVYLAWVFGFLIFTLLIECSLSGLDILEVHPWNHTLIPSIILIFGAVILGPIAEELLFRGFILNGLLKRNINLHIAVFLQAVFFVMLHNYSYENTLSSYLGIVQGFVDASLYAYARQHTKSLYTPITMHMTGNAIAILERFVL